MSFFADKPSVQLSMTPSSPISELDKQNVTLYCDVTAGNPKHLTTVKWFMEGSLLKQLPYCHDDLHYDVGGDEAGDSDPFVASADYCNVDPSVLMLEHVSKVFHGNFSCEGANEAGWSERSLEKPLEIHCEYYSWQRLKKCVVLFHICYILLTCLITR